VAVLGAVVAGAAAQATRPAAPEAIALPGIENAYRLGPKLYSGGQPEGEAAFSALKKLGVKTIVSVDGAEPDVGLAREYGMTYVHLPIGYDGMTREQAVRIAEAARRLPGPMFLHCHHGKHRGPAAAGVCAIATEGWTPDQATAWMKAAGTDPRYRGLYEAAQGFQPPTEAERAKIGDDFPETTPVPALVELMVGIDHQGDALKAVQKSWDAEKATRAASLLREGYREAQRLAETGERGPDFVKALTTAEANAAVLVQALGAPGGRTDAEAAILRTLNDCTTCHAAHRDTR
jgi:protein tyrosine phosphatase (PTP) superfamily phosphohydrolase (DUF442 family)